MADLKDLDLSPIPYDFYTKVLFGKHKGKIIKRILNCDPGWLWWAKKNVRDFVLTPEVTDALLDEIMKIQREDSIKFHIEWDDMDYWDDPGGDR
jgi:hypothetical protein